MKKITLAHNLVQYQFPPYPGKHFGFNIFALIDQDRALLIDTGFEEHAAAVLKDLTAAGVLPQQVILSHFHDDHIYGLKALPKLPTFGSGQYQVTLDRYTPPEEHPHFTPTHILNDGEALTFGDFCLKFLVMPGHAPCNVYTIINEQFIHVGDDILFSNDDEPILPSIELDRVGEHIASLEKLKAFTGYTFLLAHGNPLTGAAISQAIDNCQRYLRAVARSVEPISYAEATADCSCAFLHQEWHTFLYE